MWMQVLIHFLLRVKVGDGGTYSETNSRLGNNNRNREIAVRARQVIADVELAVLRVDQVFVIPIGKGLEPTGVTNR